MQQEYAEATQAFLNKIDELKASSVSSTNNDFPAINFATSIISFINWFKNTSLKFTIDGEVSYTEISQKSLETYLFNFTFPKRCKDLTLLFRDVIINLNKAEQQLIDAKFSEATFNQLVSNSSESISKALIETKNSIVNDDDKVKNLRPQQVAFNQNTYSTPLTVIIEQLEKIEAQINNITSLHLKLKMVSAAYANTEAHIYELEKTNATFLDFLSLHNNPLPSSISNLDEAIAHIKKLMVDVEKIGHGNVAQETALFDSLKNQGVLSVPITIDNGIVISRQLNMHKSLTKWYEAEIATELVEVFSKQELVRTNVLSQFSNLLNNLRFAQSKERPLETVQLTKQQDRLTDEYNSFYEYASKKFATIHERIADNLEVSFLFDEKELFLVPFHRPLNKYGNTSIKQANTLVASFWNKVQSKYASVLPFGNVNAKLATQELIDFRMAKDQNEQYDALFLNRTFIGDLFLLERETLEAQAFRAYTSWQKGFDGALLVKGERLSGKTSFFEAITKKLSDDKPVVLKPNQNATINGRKFKCDIDIHITLQEIVKNSDAATKNYILLDDVELWQTPSTSMLEVAKEIKEFIAIHGDQFFIMIGCSSGTAASLQSWIQFEAIFTAVIDVSKASDVLIVNALMLRHEASQQDLVNDNGDILDTERLQKRIRKIARHCDYNIGVCLQTWTYMTNQTENGNVLFNMKLDRLRDTFSANQKAILNQLDRYIQLNDIELKELVKFSDDQKFKQTISQLFHSKIIVRDITNGISINPVVTNEIHKIIN